MGTLDATTIGLLLAALFLVSFLLGSIPWGVIISKLFFKKDIRDEGSGNIGATNAMRSMGKKGGIPVFLLDFAKGLMAGFLGHLLAMYFVDCGEGAHMVDIAHALALTACTWGHIFSPWLKFKGGKGITVAFGCMFFSFGPTGALGVLLCFLILVAITRRISCGSLAGAVADIAFGFYFFRGSWIAIAICALTGLTVIWAHRANIGRLVRGEEPKIGDKKKAAQAAQAVSGDAPGSRREPDAAGDSPVGHSEGDLR